MSGKFHEGGVPAVAALASAQKGLRSIPRGAVLREELLPDLLNGIDDRDLCQMCVDRATKYAEAFPGKPPFDSPVRQAAYFATGWIYPLSRGEGPPPAWGEIVMVGGVHAQRDCNNRGKSVPLCASRADCATPNSLGHRGFPTDCGVRDLLSRHQSLATTRVGQVGSILSLQYERVSNDCVGRSPHVPECVPPETILERSL